MLPPAPASMYVLLDGEHFNRGAIASRRLLRAE
jgi:hypothetical protein